MLTGKEYIRYSRQIMLEAHGELGQEKLKQATALIIGMGGLGCPVTQYLAAAGVGTLILMDDDLVAADNLHRQILYSDDQVGQPKVIAAKKRLQELNSTVNIQAIEQKATQANLPDILASADAVLDCTDNIDSRQLINRLAFSARKKLIIGAGIRLEAQVISFDFSKNQEGCYQCLTKDMDDEHFNCATAGVLGPILGIAGSMQALSAIKAITGKGFVSHQWQCFDGSSQKWLSIKYPAESQCEICGAGR